jgi:peptidoglycan-associated lipoprotein
MMRASSLLMLLATAGFAVACGGKPKPEEPVPQAEPAPAPTPPAPTNDAAERDRLERERMAREAAERAKTLAADLAAMINFDYDQATIRQNDEATLDRKAAVLAANPNVKLTISGHADERGSDEYNLALSKRRSTEAKKFLVSRGVAPSRVETAGYGEEQPLDNAATEAAWAMNRRDEFTVTGGKLSQR